MVDNISKYILNNFLYKGEQLDDEKEEIILFGITRIVEDVPKYLLIFIISLVLGITKQVGIVLIITLLYKTFVGGAHARTNITCLIFSTLYFILPVLIAKYLIIPELYMLVIYVFVFIQSAYVILRIAPADTEEVPVINKKRRVIMKVLGVVVLFCLYGYMIFIQKDIFVLKIILITIFFINIFTNKFMYRLLKCKYSYESDEFKEYFN